MRCWGAVENDMPSLRLNTHTHRLEAISNMHLTPDYSVRPSSSPSLMAYIK